MSITHPISLPPNFVWRGYTGGARLRSFRGAGDPGADNHFPEDWLASSVRARNPGRDDPAEGLSRVSHNGREMLWPDLLEECGDELLGAGRSAFGALVKLLDSSVALHLQAHPSREFARRKLKSDFGKTECWYVLATRSPESHVCLGFQRPPTPENWLDMVLRQDREAMRGCFDKIPVKPGDCFMVPAGVPHAIGEGVFMIELQEPSDWVVRCEWEAGGYTLPEEARWMGLQPQECVEMFDYRRYGMGEIDDTFRQRPRLVEQQERWRHEEIVAPEGHSFFRLERLRGRGRARWKGGESMIAIVTRGSGKLDATEIAAGQTWFLPAAAPEWTWEASDGGDWEILLALSPAPMSGLGALLPPQ